MWHFTARQRGACSLGLALLLLQNSSAPAPSTPTGPGVAPPAAHGGVKRYRDPLERIKACPGLSLRKLRALLLAEGYRNRRGKAIKVTQFHRLRHRLAREGAHAPGGAV